MAGYRQGGDIAERFLTSLEQPGIVPLADRLAGFAAAEDDPRVAEILGRLNELVLSQTESGT